MQNANDTTARPPKPEVGRLAYPVNDLCRALGIGRSKLYEEIRGGRLQAKKLGGRTLITAEAASAYLSRLPDAKG